MRHEILEYLDEGKSIIPICPDKKRPLVKWAQYQMQAPSDAEWERWNTQFDGRYDVGLLTGAINQIVVVDADSETAIAWVEANLPYTPITCSTKRGKHFYYRHPDRKVSNSSGALFPGVDIRGDGGYVKVPPSAGYEWKIDEGCDWHDMPVWASSSDINLDLSKAKGRQDRKFPVGMTEGSRNATLTTLAGHFARIGYSFDELREALGLANAHNASPLPDEEIETIAKSIYNRERAKHVSVMPIALPPVETEFPSHLLSPGGLLGDMMAYTEQSSKIYQPVFALAAGIATIGALLGQRIATVSGLRSNFYFFAVGESGTGKEAAREAMATMLSQSIGAKHLGPGRFASPAAVFKTLNETPSCIAFIDEIGHYISKAKSSSHAAGIMPILTELFTSSGRTYLGDAYGASDRSRVIIEQPNLCIYGTTVPGILYDHLSPDDISDGFYPRWLVWEVDADQPPPRRKVDKEVPQDLLDQMTALELAFPAMESNSSLSRKIPKPHVIQLSADAEELLEEYADHCRVQRNACRQHDPLRAGILNRCAEHANKLAMIKAISDTRAGAIITLEQAQWAIHLVEHLSENMIRSAHERVSVNDFDRYCNKYLNVISRSGSNGVSKRELSQRVRGPRGAEVDEIISMLEMRGLIVSVVPERALSGQLLAIRYRRAV